MVGQFGVLIVVGRDAAVNLNFGERYDWGGSSSIVCNHELALTPSIRCSHCFIQGAHQRCGDTLGMLSRGAVARGHATSALLHLNRHRIINSGELLVLTRYLHHPIVP